MPPDSISTATQTGLGKRAARPHGYDGVRFWRNGLPKRFLPPSKTQLLIVDHIMSRGLMGDELLLEALLWRGFLAFQDQEGIWLGTGSHEEDIAVLCMLDEVIVDEIKGHPHRMAWVSLSPTVSVEDIAHAIVLLPHHDGFSSCGPGETEYGNLAPDWMHYRRMQWGAKRAVCPAKKCDGKYVYNALDTGVALLVKTLPLARVTTALSCDGHGEKPAYINLFYPWDAAWGEAVFEALGMATPHSNWHWKSDWDTRSEPTLYISPLNNKADEGWIGMLDDIQQCARRLMDQSTIDNIGKARKIVLSQHFGTDRYSIQRFAIEARRQLASVFRPSEDSLNTSRLTHKLNQFTGEVIKDGQYVDAGAGTYEPASPRRK